MIEGEVEENVGEWGARARSFIHLEKWPEKFIRIFLSFHHHTVTRGEIEISLSVT